MFGSIKNPIRPTLALISFIFFLQVVNVYSQQFYGCNSTSYPPKNKPVPTYDVNLDEPPDQRWNKLMKDKGHIMISMVDDVKDIFEAIMGKKVFEIVTSSLYNIVQSLPKEYSEEMTGISRSSGLSLPLVTLYNLFYEAFAFCTSIIAEDSQGNLIHGRNLDNGAFLGWDVHNHTWIVAEKLSRLAVKVNWIKDGKVVYQSINFAGYVGILTATRKGKFSISIDKRIYPTQSFMGLLEWVLFKEYDQKWISFLARDVMLGAKDYHDALSVLSTTKLLAPVYFILSGVKTGEGCIITRDRQNKNLLFLNSTSAGQGSWYVVETNYDHWKPTPFFDKRREAAEQCLQKATQSSASRQLIYNVLSTRPVLNKGTAYTALMDASTGSIDAWTRVCPDPCWPW